MISKTHLANRITSTPVQTTNVTTQALLRKIIMLEQQRAQLLQKVTVLASSVDTLIHKVDTIERVMLSTESASWSSSSSSSSSYNQIPLSGGVTQIASGYALPVSTTHHNTRQTNIEEWMKIEQSTTLPTVPVIRTRPILADSKK